MTSKLAETAVHAIKSELERRGKAAVIAVADAHGELVALLRLDEAPLPSTLIATNKAFTSARERKPTRDIGQKSRDSTKGFDISYFGDPRYVGWGGGVPVLKGNQVIGAIAVSGLSEAEDEELANLGLEAINRNS
jgi:glc operon protein GlcG